MLIDLHIRDDILDNFPNYEYWNSPYPEQIDFTVVNNLVGQQQESFILYWILKQIKEHGGVGLDIGSGQEPHIFSVGINDYHGESHPVYGGKYQAHITSLAENITCLNEGTFSWIIASHILEHVDNPILTFRNWFKLLRKDGIIILLMPDARYEIFSWDVTHKTYWTPEDFKNNCILPNQDILKVERENEFSNKFSFSFVGRRL